eukprot:CAMPEP_0168626686 /NCGR_PEP_ID=MMETSP0449_2-20121227/10779_1 /TAXON_ID=1082188 /ORGANISM="Strombidium rassoulzadegani, Strain ras09" /LENGTH=88 /DNA_ID=CAMNT_0008668727 /DNA_START=49 /DNA_END=312 /DNA_ORIENTATION=-
MAASSALSRGRAQSTLSSELHGRLLNGQEAEPLLAGHPLLLVGVVGGKPGGVSANGGLALAVLALSMVLEGVNSLALGVQEVSEVHFC